MNQSQHLRVRVGDFTTLDEYHTADCEKRDLHFNTNI
jgi:hypothetical protein